MKIFINDSSIDFELTNEQSVGEVVDELQSWISEKGLFLIQVTVDDKSLDGYSLYSAEKNKSFQKDSKVASEPNEGVSLDTPLKTVEEIRCEVLSAVAYVVSVWSELKLSFEPFKKITVLNISEQSEDMLARIEWSKSIIAKINQFFSSTKESAPLLKLVKDLELEIFKLKKNTTSSLDTVEKLLKQIDQEIEQGLFILNTKIIKSGLKEDVVAVRHSIENYLIYLELVEEKLVEVAIHFQKTQITQGFSALASVSDGLGIFFILSKQIDEVLGAGDGRVRGAEKKLTTKTPQVSKSLTVRKVLQDTLKTHLDALSEAITNNDYIDAADIVEYEIKELMPQVHDVLTKELKELNELNILDQEKK